MAAKRRFELVLIKPSHYDRDGYVIQWWRSLIPSNTLAALHGLASDCAARRVLGPDVDIVITAIDETNTRVRTNAIIRRIARAGRLGMVGLVGVQSNQFPRALDIAGPLRVAGVPVVVGGFHVSGCLAMLPEMDADLKRALDIGCSLFAGEAEGRLDTVIADAANGRLEPIYNYLGDLPGIEGTPVPYMPSEILHGAASFDAGRGCPFQCSFCTIINVQGRKSRRRSPDDIEQVIRRNVAQGVPSFFVTDDNFARNKDWEAILDRIIHLREVERIGPIRLTIQVDTQCHKIPNFIEKCRRANVLNMFVGLENINPDTLIAMKKRQNKIAEYRELFLAAKKARILTMAGYILGFPNDTPESILRDIEIIKRELPLDLIEFMVLTPLPGSEDHQKLAAAGGWMDPDMNKYDLNQVVARHPKMSTSEWEEILHKAWDAYYTPEHFETVMRRGEAFGIGYRRTLDGLAFFRHCIAREGLHPMDGGFLRLKRRRDRRPGLERENLLAFYPRFWRETVAKTVAIAREFMAFHAIGKCIAADPERFAYTDKALSPSTEADDESFELLSRDEAARAAVRRYREVRKLAEAAPGAR
ncbi:MAG TPA: radical SAM protein [Roseiarcus sp.]|jgi:hypothetical protein|nr:radical SAM protein [Roseiarcus sp.]